MTADLFTSSREPGGRTIVRSLFYLVPVAAIVLVLYHDLYSGTVPPTTTAHPEQSINVALNAHFCGKPGATSHRHSVQVFLSTRLDLMSHPFVGAINRQAGGITEYCRTVTDPVVVSENSLMWLTRLALRANSRLTPDGLGQFLGACRVLMLLVFGFALLRTGASAAFTFAALLVGCAILRAVGVRDSIYPFVLTAPLLNAALCGVARSSRAVMNRGPALWVFAFGMGALTTFSASMRTINLPVSVAMFGVFLFVLVHRLDASRRAAAKAVVAPVAMFVLGYVAYAALFIWPLRVTDNPNVSNYVYHTFAHELVMGLAVPENDLSRREGIEWNDEVGFRLARRVMPEVTYLGPLYEQALLRYYRGLWRNQPRAMAAVYARKLHATGTEVFLSAALVGTQFGIPRAPGEWLHRATDGVALLALGLAMFGLALRSHLQGGDARLLIIALVSLTALASLAEAFLTYSVFVGLYYSSLLFFVFFVFLTAVQAAVDKAARWALPGAEWIRP